MIKKINIRFLLLLLTFVSLKAISQIHHNISIHHPGKPQMNTELVLMERQNEDPLKSRFYTDVVSVYCIENLCKIDTVRLHWNSLGRYIRYELPPTIDLEKAEGKPFTNEDYDQLQKILFNPNSVFASLAIDDIVKKNDVDHGMEVDGYSGATVIALRDGETVQGAALTCYTLWHWANGDICDSIRNITGDHLANNDLIDLLGTEKSEWHLFVLEQFYRKAMYTQQDIQALLAIHTENKEFVKLRIQYLESATDEIYFLGMKQLLMNAPKNERIIVFQSILGSNKQFNSDYLDSLCEVLPKLESYREVDLFISIMEKQNPNSQTLKESLLPLLKKDILVARRAYWFLENQELSATQQKAMKKFYKKNEEYL